VLSKQRTRWPSYHSYKQKEEADVEEEYQAAMRDFPVK
jgi:hypothetical protein